MQFQVLLSTMTTQGHANAFRENLGIETKEDFTVAMCVLFQVLLSTITVLLAIAVVWYP